MTTNGIIENIQPGELFSVYQFFSTGSYEKVRDAVPIEDAIIAAKHYTSSVAVQMGLVEKVMITDLGDRCVFEWTSKDGVIFPKVDAKGKVL